MLVLHVLFISIKIIPGKHFLCDRREEGNVSNFLWFNSCLKNCIEVIVIYNIVLVSGVLQSDSVIQIFIRFSDFFLI